MNPSLVILFARLDRNPRFQDTLPTGTAGEPADRTIEAVSSGETAAQRGVDAAFPVTDLTSGRPTGASTRIDCFVVEGQGPGRAFLELVRRGDLVELVGTWQLSTVRDEDGKPVTRRRLQVRRLQVMAVPPARPIRRRRTA